MSSLRVSVLSGFCMNWTDWLTPVSVARWTKNFLGCMCSIKSADCEKLSFTNKCYFVLSKNLKWLSRMSLRMHRPIF